MAGDTPADGVRRWIATLAVRSIRLCHRFYRWRAECPSCGRPRHNLTAPYGWTCDNPACERQRMPETGRVTDE